MSEQEKIFVYWDEYRDPDAVGWHWFEVDGEPLLIEAASELTLEANETELIAAIQREGIQGDYYIDWRRHVDGHVYPDTETKWSQLRAQLSEITSVADAIYEDYRVSELLHIEKAHAIERILKQLKAAKNSIREAGIFIDDGTR